ncbi:MAG: ligase-associated DNA damage response exonuclease [Pseudomonadota bacterium]
MLDSRSPALRRPVLELTSAGLYCPAGGFHVDPWGQVDRAVVTHGHSDHARPGHAAYEGSALGEGIVRRRLGTDIAYQGHPYGEAFRIGDALVSFHPAGHVLGSAQVRIEVDGEVWVVSGDYKREPDPSCTPFELVPCDGFVTEATFALPIYRWDAGARVIDEVLAWWDENVRQGRTSIVFCYALGKAQRLLAEIGARLDRPVFLHGALLSMVDAYRDAGVELASTMAVSDQPKADRFRGEFVLAPPSAMASTWMRRFTNPSTAFVSGWMRVRGQRRRRGYDRGFVLSDHVDWPDVVRTVEETGARQVLATHGYADSLARFLREERGLDARPIETLYEGERDDG